MSDNEALIEGGAAENTDRQLWFEQGDGFRASLHVTKRGGIGINVGGHVIVKTLSEWHRLAFPRANDGEVIQADREAAAKVLLYKACDYMNVPKPVGWEMSGFSEDGLASAALHAIKEALASLSPVMPAVAGEDYCVGLWTEEKGEVLQLIGKAMRFGIDTPGVKRLDGTVDMAKTPRSMLETEMGDALAAVEFAALHGIVRRTEVFRNRERKLAKLLNPDAKDNLGRPLAPQPAPSPAMPEGVGVELTYNRMGSGGRCSFQQLREAVAEANCGRRDLADPAPENIYPGHVMVEGCNYNSLDRIVTAFVDAALRPDGDARGEPDRYDTGLLGDGGGGNDEWWRDYIRAELDRAHEFYADQFALAPDAAPKAKAMYGSKTDPANIDCINKALPDEPMFIVLGRDPDGANIVRLWAERRLAADPANPEHAERVLKLAEYFEQWQRPDSVPVSAPPAENYAAPKAMFDGEIYSLASFGVDREAKALTYDQARMRARELGFSGIYEALGWIDEMRLAAPKAKDSGEGMREALTEAEGLLSSLWPQVPLHVRRNMLSEFHAHIAKASRALGKEV